MTPTGFLRGATILVVDDELANCVLVERMLGGSVGAEVHTLVDPRETVRECLRLSPDLLLLDLHMPAMDGIAVLSELRTQLDHESFLPVIVLTADITSGAKERALNAGANDFLTKPFDHTEVLLRVGNLLDTRSRFSELQTRNEKIQASLDTYSAQADRVEEFHQQRLARTRQAFEPGVLRAVFQPIVDLGAGETVGVEALARFESAPQRSPDKWFTEAVTVGLGTDLELLAISTALDEFAQLGDDRFLSVNTSPATAASSGLRESLTGTAPDRIVLELTEHVPVQDYVGLIDALADLREDGIRIAIDDAGTGYAGLEHLLQIRPDIVKLDMELTRGVHADPSRRALTTAMVTFCDEINATIVAEGIETAEDLDVLRSLGVPWGQGYHIARPGPLLR